MELMSINWVTVIANVVNVLVFFALMKHFLFKPVNEIMEKRNAQIQGDLDDAANEKEEALKLKKDYEESIADAKQEAADIIDKAKKSSAKEHDEAIAKTKEETDKMIADAKESIEADREKAMLVYKSFSPAIQTHNREAYEQLCSDWKSIDKRYKHISALQNFMLTFSYDLSWLFISARKCIRRIKCW
jgi:F-type H+-transporting ATPase subunit b